MAALARRAHSRAELGRKLARKGYEAEEVTAALDRAAAAGYLDDAAYARGLAGRRASARGPAAIAAELRAKGVGRDDTDAALARLDPEQERMAAATLAQRMVGPGADRAATQRAAARLLRRGFSADAAWAAVRAAAGR